ncbi:MAG TPA: T9SS type A sorting domain-containing protein [Bacteroidetes bacterium]|nr:T9SS type A sorting domain-containing protein [Bacteroidota bacterium]
METRLLQIFTCVFLYLLFTPQNINASHMVGEDITWECINNCTTRVVLRTYRDCTGATTITNSVNFTPTAPGCTAPNPLGAWSPQTTTEVTPICPSIQTLCTSPLATIRGVQEYYWYRDYNVCGLGTNCTFDLFWGSCCRNAAITSGAGSQGMGITNHMDISLGCNNSPVFTNTPLFMACSGTPYTIHQGAYDPDGDSLTFSLAPCHTNAPSTLVPYAAGYSPTSPLGSTWTINFDPNTGMLDLIPNPGSVVVGVICIAVNEYRNGNLIGTTIRDMQVQVITCPANSQPTLSPISNLSPNAVLSSPSVISACSGYPLCFDITATDPDSSLQTISLAWDLNIPGATFQEVGNSSVQDTILGNSPDGRFCWASPTAGVHQFLITLRDNACPIFGTKDKLITIIISNTGIPSPLITATGSIDSCSGSSMTLTATGGFSNYLWSNSATTQSITVSNPGIYTVSASNASSCPLLDAYTAVDMPNPQLSGTITTSTSTALAYQKVYLITHNSTNNSLTAQDSTTTDTLGYYSFCNVPFDTVYVKAAPDSATYPTEMPTYADTAIYWNNAGQILSVNFPTVVNFSTRFGTNPGGPGFIGGYISQGANKRQGPGDPMPNIRVILYSNTLNQFVDETYSNGNGYFSFSNIPLGDYKVSVDVAGVNHLTVPNLLLNAQTPIQDNLDFRLHTTYFELVTLIATASPLSTGFNFEAFPNPSRSATTILLELEDETDALLRVFNLNGREVKTLSAEFLHAGTHHFTFDPAQEGLASGVYFIRLDAVGFSKTIKFITMDN